ncbi:hypothetical protein GCM10020001_024960 [Nonomuraea salmonea]
MVRPGGLGPDSVGYRIATEALVFGGTTATMTDAAVAAGRVPAGADDWQERLRGDDVLTGAVAVADELVADAVDRMTLGRADRPLVAVGGGAFLLPAEIPGVSRVIRPEHAEVANAVGGRHRPRERQSRYDLACGRKPDTGHRKR